MKSNIIVLISILVPVIGSMLLPLAGYFSKRLRNILSLLFILTPFLAILSLIHPVLTDKPIVFGKEIGFLGFNFTFIIDGLSVFMALVSSFISAIIMLYSFGYISHYENQNEYYSMVVLFLGAMMGIIFSGNLVLLFIFWEITAITSWRLIGFFRGGLHLRMADKAFLVTVFGALLMLLGFIMIYHQTGSFDITVIKEKIAVNPASTLAIVLILAGIFSKSATLPFHTWLPDAGVAPSPVTALLHAALLVKIGVYVFARLFVTAIPLDVVLSKAVLITAVISTIVAGGCAMFETDLKRIIAYSTISQIGFIFFGLAAGVPIGIVGAMLYILMHGIAKAGLFLCAGIVEQNTKTKDITKLGGLITSMPVTGISFLFCAFSVMGIPPFGGFFSKYMVFKAGVENGYMWISLLFFIGAVFTIVYLLRVFNLVFLGEAKFPGIKEKSPLMVSSVLILAVVSLLAGILVNYPYGFIDKAIGALK